MPDINLPDVVAEVTEAFNRYERALMANDVETLNACFWDSPLTLRYGIAENLYGIDAIKAFRGAARTPPTRYLKDTSVVALGRDAAVVNTEFHREAWRRCGRQSQTWARFPQGWRIVSAHVSIID